MVKAYYITNIVKYVKYNNSNFFYLFIIDLLHYLKLQQTVFFVHSA